MEAPQKNKERQGISCIGRRESFDEWTLRSPRREGPQRAGLSIDGKPASGLDGDTLMVAVLNQTDRLRVSEFGDGARSGFCLMGACQDCWLWSESGERLRACTTPLEEGMRILTQAPGREWLKIAS